jgi:hypothetical protein
MDSEVTLPLRLEAKRQQAQSEGNPEDGGGGRPPGGHGARLKVWASADSDEPGRVPFAKQWGSWPLSPTVATRRLPHFPPCRISAKDLLVSSVVHA